MYVVASPLTLFFSFAWSSAHRDLYSFPTRRSSDLDPFVRPGDIVYVTQGDPVFVTGMVTQPQPVFIKDQMTLDRKSTRLNSSHANISYAVFCLKKKITLNDSSISDL